MKEKELWIKISSGILLAGGALLFTVSPVAFIPDPDLRIVAALFTLPVFFLAAVLIPCGIFNGKDLWNVLRLKPLQKEDLFPVLTTIPVFFLFAVLTALWQKITGSVSPQLLIEYAGKCSSWQFILILISAGILAPVSEELVFRQTITGFVGKFITEDKFAIYLIPSLLFALSHGIIWQSVLLFFFALYLQWHQITGSTTRSIFMHGVFNWCSLMTLILMRAGILPENLQM